MNVKKLRNILAVTMTSTALLAPAAWAEKVELLFNNFLPPMHIISSEAWPEWAKRVEEATEGRVTIKFPPSSLAPPPRQWEAVTQGLADGALLFHGFAENHVTLPHVAELPWLAIDSAEAMGVALWRTQQKFGADHEYDDVVLVGMYAAPGGEFYSLNETPIQSVEQMRDLRSWATPGAPASVLKNLEAPVETSPTVRAHEYVGHGVVDAYMGASLYDSESFRLLNHVGAVTEFEDKISVSTFSVFLNRNAWNRISEKDQKAIMSVSGENLARLHGSIYDKANKSARQSLMDRGVEFHEPSPEFIRKLGVAGEPVVKKWLEKMASEGRDGQAAKAYYVSELQKVREEMEVD